MLRDVHEGEGTVGNLLGHWDSFGGHYMQRVECGGVSVVDVLELSRCPCGAGDLENGSPVGIWGEAEVHEEEHRLSPVVRSRGRVPQGRGGVLLLE